MKAYGVDSLPMVVRKIQTSTTYSVCAIITPEQVELNVFIDDINFNKSTTIMFPFEFETLVFATRDLDKEAQDNWNYEHAEEDDGVSNWDEYSDDDFD